MFNSFQKLKLGFRINLGFIAVLLISLLSGIALGKNITSPYVIAGLVITVIFVLLIANFTSRSITNSIKSVLDGLAQTSTNLNSLSKDLTETGHRLAEGSSEQAASVQETSSTLEESSSMVHQTTQNTKEAETLAKQTKDASEKGNSEMTVMLDAMEELKNSSHEISKIIKVIDEIAFQTNILSLNAAVEAARAGDAGKGFAVVAEEVRNLAQRSAQAAKDTTDIIESNISLSEKCLKISVQVGSSLNEIMEDTHKVNELLEEITSASQEQEIGIAQINQAVAQMEQVLQENASTAQQSASSADELSSHSLTIEKIMTGLKSLIDGEKEPKISLKKIKKAEKSKEKAKKPVFSTQTKKEIVKNEPEQKTCAKIENIEQLKPSINTEKTQKTTPKTTREEAKPAQAFQAKPQTQTKAGKKDLGQLNGKKIRPEDIIPLDDF